MCLELLHLILHSHLVNLLREGAAKGKLNELGLTSQSLHKLSGMPDYSYLKKILKLKNGSLFYDPMNQSSSYKLFSEDTEKGLKDIGDLDGARCCKVIREGLIESLDISGISSEVRCWKLFKFKCYFTVRLTCLTKSVNQELIRSVQSWFRCCTVRWIRTLLTTLIWNFLIPEGKALGVSNNFSVRLR